MKAELDLDRTPIMLEVRGPKPGLLLGSNLPAWTFRPPESSLNVECPASAYSDEASGESTRSREDSQVLAVPFLTGLWTS